MLYNLNVVGQATICRGYSYQSSPESCPNFAPFAACVGFVQYFHFNYAKPFPGIENSKPATVTSSASLLVGMRGFLH